MPSKLIPRICEVCRKDFQATQSEVNRGRGRFCGNRCSVMSRAPRRQCQGCGHWFELQHKGQICCSKRCGAATAKWKTARRVQAEKMKLRSWQFAVDTRQAEAERGKKWIEDTERPRVNPRVPMGALTKWGKVAAVGMNAGGRYYMLLDDKGVVSQRPAEEVEA